MAGVPRVRRREAPEGRAEVQVLSGPRVLVVGTGAMASLCAARLARSGAAEVTLAGTWREALTAIAARGVVVEEEDRTWSVPVAALPLDRARGPADVALVLVKSHQTAAVAGTAADVAGGSGLLVTLQNGLGNREALEAAAGPAPVVVGVLTLGATLLAPGRVRTVPGKAVLGCAPAADARVNRLADLLRASGIDTELRCDIDSLIWGKLAVNCAINPLSALLGLPNGALLTHPDARDTLVRAAREVGQVARARGIELEADPADLALAVAARTASNRSSMLQDVDRGARTEIDALNGAVVREGTRLGVPTPVNASLWRQVLQLETQRGADPSCSLPSSPLRGGG